MRAMAAPTVSHLDPAMLALLDDVRARLGRLFRAPDGSFAFAVSGTGTSGMETAVANLVREGTRALVVVTGYFGERLAQMCERYGAIVKRVDVEWGRACNPEVLRAALKASPADLVCLVHAETSTGVLNPLRELAAIAREHGALTIVDAVTSFGGHPLDVDEGQDRRWRKLTVAHRAEQVQPRPAAGQRGRHRRVVPGVRPRAALGLRHGRSLAAVC